MLRLTPSRRFVFEVARTIFTRVLGVEIINPPHTHMLMIKELESKGIEVGSDDNIHDICELLLLRSRVNNNLEIRSLVDNQLVSNPVTAMDIFLAQYHLLNGELGL